MSGKIVFYTNPMSRGRIVRWMLEEVGIAYSTVILEYGAAMKTAEFLAINPMGKVPALCHGEVVVTECAAICAYLADSFPQAGLAPPPAERGDYYRWLFYSAGPLEAAITNHTLGFNVPQDRQSMAGYGSYEAAVNTLEKAVFERSHIAGERFSAADVYVGSQVGWGLRFGALPERPAFHEYWSRLSARSACKRAAELDDALLKDAGN